MDFIIKNGILTAYQGKAFSVHIPEGVKIIGRNAFFRCHFLHEITFPQSLEEIREDAFRSCNGLTKILLPQNLKRIERDAFRDCKNLQEVWLTSKVCEYQIRAFLGTPCSFHMIGGAEELFCILRSGRKLFSERWGEILTIHHPRNLEKIFAFPISENLPVISLVMELYLMDWGDETTTFIERCFPTFFPIYMEKAPIEKVEKFFRFLNAANIDEIILDANERKLYELQILLMNYKYEVLGFSDNPFKL